MLCASFGAWHELRRPVAVDSEAGLLHYYAQIAWRKIPWLVVLGFQFVWVFSPRTASLLVMLLLGVEWRPQPASHGHATINDAGTSVTFNDPVDLNDATDDTAS